jgi:hypothetical protein
VKPADFAFTQEEAKSPAGKKVREFMQARLQQLLEDNASPALTDRQTDLLRGRIKELRDLIARVTFTPQKED